MNYDGLKGRARIYLTGGRTGLICSFSTIMTNLLIGLSVK